MSLFLLTSLITTVVAVVVNGLQFDMNTLTLTNLKFLGDAHLTNNSIRLSKDLGVPNTGAGRVFYSMPIPFQKPEALFPTSFSTFFSFSITNLNPSSIGGGLAFFISPDDESLGGAGGFLGLGGSDGGGLSEFVAVEFDTLMDLEFRDLNGNHVGIDVNGMVSVQAADLGVSGIELKSGDLISAWIDFDGVTRLLNVSVSYFNLKPEFPILSYKLDSIQQLSDFMFAGFSGSTQGSTEIHSIEWWSFSSFFPSNPNHSVSAPSPSLANLVVPSATLANSTDPLLTNSTNSTSSPCRNQLCKGAVAGVATAGAFCLAFCSAAVIWIVFTKRVKNSDSLETHIVRMPKVFTYKDLKSATKCFNSNMIIGHGAVGVVYKGVMPGTGDIIAVKRCSHNTHGKNEFLSELSIIRNLRHRNLLKLQGWCQEKGEILLVYDLMPNGSLDKALFETTPSTSTLSWHHRRNILIGVASALAYLHQECEHQVIHRDVKTSNIMLDECFKPRLGDFGLAKQVEHDRSPEATVAAGTMGYLAPEYLLTGIASEKTDVFSYGVVVLEVASGRRPIDKEMIGVDEFGEGSNLVERVWSLHRVGKLLSAADERLGGEFDEAEMMRVLLVGLACSNPDPSTRPRMRGVVQMLAGEAEAPVVPRSRPTLTFSNSELVLSLQDSVSDCDGVASGSSSCSSEDSCSIGRDELV